MALYSHRSVNPTLNCVHEGLRLHAPYENHPEIIPPLLISGKTVFHETSPWYQKGWGLFVLQDIGDFKMLLRLFITILGRLFLIIQAANSIA